MHSHSDIRIKSCTVCQNVIKEIEESVREMDELGLWSIPTKTEKGIVYTIWKRKG